MLTGLDYWLDNLMCNVPEVVMCFHMDGIVQVELEEIIIYNQSLDSLQGEGFSPRLETRETRR